MYKITLFILAIILFVSCNNQESIIDKGFNLEKTPVSDSVDLWLTEGKHSADIMNAFDPRITYLSEKIAIAIKDNQEWYFEYLKAVPEGKTMPYHENIGLSEEEYSELLELQSNYEVYSSGAEEFITFKKDDSLYFKTNGNVTQILNYLSFDLQKNIAILTMPEQGTINLNIKDTVDNKSDQHAYKSPWHGYIWTNEKGNINQDLDGVKSISDLQNFTIFELTIGIMDRDKRIFLSFKVQSIVDGEVVANNELPILIK